MTVNRLFRLKPIVAAVFVLLSLGYAAPIIAQTSVPGYVGQKRAASTRSQLDTLLEAQRQKRMAEHSRENRHAFVDARGVTTLTNRPEKYVNREGYKKIDLHLKPIKVSSKLRAHPLPTRATELLPIVNYYSQYYKLDPYLVLAVIKCESNFRQDAVSRAGASGLMQLMPGTASDMGVTDIFDPTQNIAGGTQYLWRMLDLFQNDPKLALAAYNAGPEAVKAHAGIPPYDETKAYVAAVIRQWGDYSKGGFRENVSIRTLGGGVVATTAPKKSFIVHFHSGIKQRADNVVEGGDFYYIHAQGRTVSVRKDRVKSIESV